MRGPEKLLENENHWETRMGGLFAGERVVYLGNRLSKSHLPEFVGAEETGEKTTTVLDGLTLYDHQAAQGSGVEVKSRHG